MDKRFLLPVKRGAFEKNKIKEKARRLGAYNTRMCIAVWHFSQDCCQLLLEELKEITRTWLRIEWGDDSEVHFDDESKNVLIKKKSLIRIVTENDSQSLVVNHEGH